MNFNVNFDSILDLLFDLLYDSTKPFMQQETVA